MERNACKTNDILCELNHIILNHTNRKTRDKVDYILTRDIIAKHNIDMMTNDFCIGIFHAINEAKGDICGKGK